MNKLKPGTQYKKDYKRFRNNPKKVEKLFRILELLQNEEPIPEENRPHPLTGNYAGHMECHIEGDFLLIWFDPDTDEINLVRLGSHSELFGRFQNGILNPSMRPLRNVSPCRKFTLFFCMIENSHPF